MLTLLNPSANFLTTSLFGWTSPRPYFPIYDATKCIKCKTNGNLYAANGTQLLIISQPDAAEPGYDNLQLQGAAHSNNNLLAYATKNNFLFSASIANFAESHRLGASII